MKRISWYPLAGLLVLVLAGLAFWQAHRPPTGAPPPTPAIVAAATANRGVAPAPAPRKATPAAPRVADGEPMPLPDGIATLLSRADAGDAKAACQLGVRLSRCRWADFYSDEMLAQLRASISKARRRNDAEGLRDSEAALAVGQAIRRECDPLPASLRERAFALTRQAALAGEPEAIVAYLRGDVLNASAISAFEFLGSPEFDAWRRDAGPMLAALEDTGRPEAVLLRLQAVRGVPPLSMVVPPDPVADEANRLLAVRLFGEHEALRDTSPRPRLTPAQRETAARLAAQWHDERHGGRRHALAPYDGALYDTLSELRRSVGEGKAAPVPCDDGTGASP